VSEEFTGLKCTISDPGFLFLHEQDQCVHMDTKGNRTMSDVKAYRVKAFCKAYGVSRSFAYNEMKAGRLKYFNIGVMRLISYEAAQEWRASYEYGKPPEAA
jgi:hypothetical protein